MFTDALKTKLDYITCRWFVLIKSTLNVEYNTIPSTNKRTIYVNDNDQNIYGGVGTEINQSVAITTAKLSPYTYTTLMISAIGDLDVSATLYRHTENAEGISKIIATRDYVVSQIQGAINASY